MVIYLESYDLKWNNLKAINSIKQPIDLGLAEHHHDLSELSELSR